MIECAGVDSGAKMLVVSEVLPTSAAERVRGMRRHVTTQNIHAVPYLSSRCCNMRFTLFQIALVWTSNTTAKRRRLSTGHRKDFSLPLWRETCEVLSKAQGNDATVPSTSIGG